ncbi:SDR family oxidoreductase [bacterium]|nr:SDR family oxidoreductase [bacterium]
MDRSETLETVLVTGGGGYVGSVLVPKLLQTGYSVKVLDLFLYGENVLNAVASHPHLEIIKGDMRYRRLLERVLPGCHAVIHLACISNDPSFELDPELGKSINYDAFIDLVAVSKDSGVKRFVYASSSSVYGIKHEESVTEELPLKPLTDYSKYKALCEEVLLKETAHDFVTLVVRPATVCGYSTRMRLDLTVNILTNHAVHNGVIEVFGGDQMRPNIHIEDMANLYIQSLRWHDRRINGRVYNAGYENYKVIDIANMVREVVGEGVDLIQTPTDDNRSYHISSDRIRRELDYEPKHTIEEAIRELVAAFRAGQIPDSMSDPRYYNIKTMQDLPLYPILN